MKAETKNDLKRLGIIIVFFLSIVSVIPPSPEGVSALYHVRYSIAFLGMYFFGVFVHMEYIKDQKRIERSK